MSNLVFHWHNLGNDAESKDISRVLVFIHPFPYDAESLLPVIKNLDFPVVCPDLPGCGDSPSDFPNSFETISDVIAQELLKKSITKAVVAGISMGGYLALALAERHPQLVQAMGLIDTKAEAEPEAGIAGRLAMAEQALLSGNSVVSSSWQGVLGESTKANRADVVALAQKLLTKASGAGIAWCQKTIAARLNRKSVVANFPGPILLFRGAEDPLSSAVHYREMKDLAQNAIYLEIPEVGHLPNLECPETLAEALLQLWNR